MSVVSNLCLLWFCFTFALWLVNRAVFNWVSKVIRVLLWFCFISLCDWLKNLAPLSRPIRSKTQTNQSRLARARTFFPALDASNMYLLRVLIGSLDNLCLLWLAGVITLVLVLRHSFEKRSKARATNSTNQKLKIKTNRDFFARVFPRLTLITCVWFNFWLVHFVFCSRCDWSE